MARAAQSLRQGEANVALDYAIEAWTLRHSVEAARIGVLACVAMHDFPAALAWRRRVGSVKSG